HIFFQNPTQDSGFQFDGCPDIAATSVGCELYVRENDAVTHWVSQSECTSSCGAVGARKPFLAATPDGSRALFESTEKLTDDATASSLDKLYLYTDSANPSSDANNLTLLNKDNEPSDGSEANLKGVLGMSDDGHTVYFVADGQLVSGADTTPANMIYRWHDGVLTYLGGMTDTQVDRENWVSFEVPSN